ncbi:transposase for IS1668 [endosymbiont of Riftia pachyptila (vent Ph05)]|uniref:Transposase for IS1668 n=2 Tax=sulfur-oxidizing symbionts TaxID=32036 RepID=G2FIS5_9GAMM|nr:transposase [endosymbiont of Riftia pachyptila]EGV51525.1 transposase for IS1668 [endosymbiont of Riftia pachyptila (vent Ph05)]EGW53318.1 transposase for IS1668 [endosymbiont of Tevnia jerichonana (vent Tica)]
MVGLDAGYNTTAVCHGLVERGIGGVVGNKRPHTPKGWLKRWDFSYDARQDVYHCPEGQRLRYSTTNRTGYREDKSAPAFCKDCPLLDRCTRSQNTQKVVIRHMWEEDRKKVNQKRLTDWGRRVSERRRETVGRSFADAKPLHGHRYARFRGLTQYLLAAACQNMKKIALLLARFMAPLPSLLTSRLRLAFRLGYSIALCLCCC